MHANGATSVSVISTAPVVPVATPAQEPDVAGPRSHRGNALVPVSTLSRLVPTATQAQLAAFGISAAKGGVAVANKDNLLGDMWRAIGFKPTMIYGLAEMGSNFGHAFIAFETANPKTGAIELMVPNVCGATGETLIQWCPLDEYLFGVSEFKGANKQRGFYNRPYTLVAINDSTIDTTACRAYVDRTLERFHKGEVGFVLSLPRVLNVLSWPLRKIGLPIREFGNCARWNSMFLRAARVFTNHITPANWFTQTTMWPKRLALRLVQGKSRIAAENTRVIYIARPQHANITSKGLHDGQTYANALTFLAGKLGIDSTQGEKYSQLSSIADARVDVPSGSITAVVSVPGH